MPTKDRDRAPGIKIHRVTAALAGQSAALNLPGETRRVLVHPRTAACRLFLDAADEAAGVRYLEVAADAVVVVEMATDALIVQATAAQTIGVITAHDALRADDRQAEDYVAA